MVLKMRLIIELENLKGYEIEELQDFINVYTINWRIEKDNGNYF